MKKKDYNCIMRYGPSDVESRTAGPSIASDYYGSLSIWR